MPTIPIVDAHLHLWTPSTHPWYPDLPAFAAAAGTPTLTDDFALADYDRAAGTEVVGLVHVSATTAPHAYLAETRWIDALAATAGRPLALIGTVDPTLSLPELLTHLTEQAQSPHFRGIRVFQGLHPNTPAADAIASWLQERDAVFDLVATPATMLDWIDFLAGYPTLRVVLEHLGLPQSTSPDDRSAWHNALSLAAKETPWHCKLSGLGMIAPDLSWTTLEYWLESSVHLWGWRRLMFGSNMPIDTRAGTYRDLLTAVDHVVATDATDQEATFFYRTNATDAYAL
ncbi:amidohydrolase family protein [Nocardia jejuensis]|uniref:amidohydrolase family protein n=1 Tax=Nocardia jejuensis TaxID=328049 RepID=UPI0008306B39|nr:amidohydrolase family protein [Nocardia jejuensis]